MGDGDRTRTGELERRLRRLEDRQQLWDLAGRYSVAIDDQDFAALAELYSSDAVYTGPTGRFDGRAAVLAYLREALERYRTSIHTAHQQLIEFEDDDVASGVVTAHVEMSLQGADETLFGAIRYLDSYVREDGRWRFRSRGLRFVHVAPWSAVGESLTTELPKRFPGAPAAPSDLPPSAERT